MKKMIIAGGRDYALKEEDYERLNSIAEIQEIGLVVSGGAKGADSGGERWAEINNIPVKHFFPDWNRHGRAAGPIRNEEMAKFADICVLFPGGRGTDSMASLAKQYGLDVYDYRT